MKHRTLRRMTALTLGAALLLTACGDDSAPEETPTEATTEPAIEEAQPTAEDIAALETVTLTGEPGTKPVLEFTAPFNTTAATARVVTEGTGADLVEGDLVALHSVLYTGQDGAVVDSTWETAPDEITLGDTKIIGALNTALVGQKVGAQLLLANPDPTSGGTILMGIEVMSARTVPSRAEGTPVEPVDGLPTVTLDDAGKPSIEIPDDYEAPAELVAQPLIQGAGAAVESGQTIMVQYSGWKVSDGEQFDSSWETGSPFSTAIDAGQVIVGWDQGLVGQTVGSQVLLVIPNDLAYGDEGGLGGEDLIFVVDILDAQ